MARRSREKSTTGVRIQNLWAGYDGEPVLRGLDLEFEPNKLYGLVGENGSGKSTLAKVLQGMIRPMEGTITGLGTYPPRLGLNYHFQAVPQHPKSFSRMSIADYFRLVANASKQKTNELLEHLCFFNESPTQLQTLSMSTMSFIAIGACIAVNPRLIFFDETTASMGPEEVELHYSLIREFTSKGGTGVVVSHRISELIGFTDEIFVLRQGKKAGTFHHNSNPLEIAQAMFDIYHEESKQTHGTFPPPEMSDPILRIQNLSIHKNNSPIAQLDKLNFELYSGEIHSILGMKEQGIEALEDCLAGLVLPSQGSISPYSPKGIPGFSYVPRDRYARGLFPGLTVLENFMIYPKEKPTYPSLPSELLHQPITSLSGGMAQTLVIDRELPRSQVGCFICEPSLGLDPNRRNAMYKKLEELKNQKKGILLLTSDVDEVLKVSDRVSVLYQGSIVAQGHVSNFNRETLSDLMLGLNPSETEI